MPLEKYLARLDIQLLDYPVKHNTVYRTTDAGEIPLYLAVDRDQGRILGRDEELVVVALVAVAGPEPGYLAVGMVADHVLALAVSCLESLPPGEHRLSLVFLDLVGESIGLGILQRMEPDRLTAGVDYQRCVLGGSFLSWTLFGRDEDVARGRTRQIRVHFDGGRTEIRARALGSQPREPESATKAVPAVRAPRNFRRVIPAPSLPLLDCSPKFALSSLASIERE